MVWASPAVSCPHKRERPFFLRGRRYLPVCYQNGLACLARDGAGAAGLQPATRPLAEPNRSIANGRNSPGKIFVL